MGMDRIDRIIIILMKPPRVSEGRGLVWFGLYKIKKEMVKGPSFLRKQEEVGTPDSDIGGERLL